MKPPELTDEQYHSLDAIWGKSGEWTTYKQESMKHIGWFFWLQFDEHDENSGIFENV
jgi:hypothetical protein